MGKKENDELNKIKREKVAVEAEVKKLLDEKEKLERERLFTRIRFWVFDRLGICVAEDYDDLMYIVEKLTKHFYAFKDATDRYAVAQADFDKRVAERLCFDKKASAVDVDRGVYQ